MKKVLGILSLLIFSGISALLFFYFSDYSDIDIDVSGEKIISDEIKKIENDYDFDDPEFDIEVLFEKENDEEISDNLTNEEKQKLREEIEAQKRIEILRNRFALQGTIKSGDEYIENGLPLLALSQYIKALSSSPNDPIIIEKLADTYFLINRFSQAANTYYKIKDNLLKEKKKKLLKSIIYTTEVGNKDNIRENGMKIETLDINRYEKVFYINALNCTINYNGCINIYENYIAEYENIESDGLERIKNAINNYKNFQTERAYYKDVLILGAIFSEGLYNISAYLGEKILKDMPEYRTILLIVGESYYNLGNYENARKYLGDYFTLESNDSQVAYMLGIINLKLRDYIRSNIHFNQVLNSNYEDRAGIKRVLAYNYYLLGNNRQMLNTLDKLVELPDSEITDFSLNIYYSIMENRKSKAEELSKKGLEKFDGKSSSEMFYGYLGWIYREKGNIDKSREYLIKGLRQNPKNPLINLNMGYLEEKRENFERALIYFRRTNSLDSGGEFGKLAEIEIENIEKYLELTKDN